MAQDEQLNIEELIASYKDYMGTQAQEIVVLKATILKLNKKIEDLSAETDKVQ
jgi:hypothetical protein